MQQKQKSWHFLFLLILAGEAVFILPFVLPRIFRPTVLQAFELSNTELGLCFSMYGIVAMICYLIGGPIADKFAPRKLIAVALWMTALGGVVFARFPAVSTLRYLYAYWGFTTIFLFWAPMIKATRIWGGRRSQGKAFGFLDGGRGMVGAMFGSLGVVIFSIVITKDLQEISLQESREAFRLVILYSSLIVGIIGLLVWLFLKMPMDDDKISLDKISVGQIKEVMKYSSVLLLMIIILCAYVGYKITDVFSLYAKEVMMYNQVDSAKVGNYLLYLRPIVGVAIGFLADKSQTTKWLFIGFVCSFLGSILFASGLVTENSFGVFVLSTLIVATGIYSVRALYFAVMEVGKIPVVLTGTAVGMISLVGYTPDIFAGPAMGYLLDSAPGVTGHQNVFWMLAGFSLTGGIASWIYYRKFDKNSLV